jgi:hypothetical protein
MIFNPRRAGLGELGQMLGQIDGGYCWRGDGAAAGLGLGWARNELTVDLGHLLGHRHPTMQQVDPLDAQADQLAQHFRRPLLPRTLHGARVTKQEAASTAAPRMRDSSRYALATVLGLNDPSAGAQSVGQAGPGHDDAMRIALMQLALCEAVVALAFAVEWVRDRRRPPGRRRFGRPYKLYVVLAGIGAVACFAVALSLND